MYMMTFIVEVAFDRCLCRLKWLRIERVASNCSFPMPLLRPHYGFSLSQYETALSLKEDWSSSVSTLIHSILVSETKLKHVHLLIKGWQWRCITLFLSNMLILYSLCLIYSITLSFCSFTSVFSRLHHDYDGYLCVTGFGHCFMIIKR